MSSMLQWWIGEAFNFKLLTIRSLNSIAVLKVWSALKLWSNINYWDWLQAKVFNWLVQYKSALDWNMLLHNRMFVLFMLAT